MAETVYSVVGDSIVMGLHLTEDGLGVSGQTPTLEIRRLRDGRYLDFSVSAAPYWKTSGGTKEKVLVAKTWLPGLYTFTFNQEVYDPDAREVYVAIYRNTAPDYEVERTEFHSFTWEWNVDVKLTRKLLTNNSFVEMLTESLVEHTWLDDDGVAELLKHKITKSGAFERREKDPP